MQGNFKRKRNSARPTRRLACEKAGGIRMANNLEALRKSTLFQGFQDEVLRRFLESAKSETRGKNDVAGELQESQYR